MLEIPESGQLVAISSILESKYGQKSLPGVMVVLTSVGKTATGRATGDWPTTEQ